VLASGGENGRRKFAFIHIQKTAGTSVEELLQAAVPDITYYGPRHMGAPYARKKLKDWDERFTFAFVRNPWDRLVSWYSMIERGANRVHEGKLPTSHWLRRIWHEPSRNPLLAHALEVLEEDPSFENFVKHCTGDFRKGGVIYSFERNQIDYLTNRRDRILVDFVGRFERLSEDLTMAFSEIGLEPSLVEDKLPHKNRNKKRLARGHYRNFYTPETAAIVAERFAKDIDYFGYEF
jgi:Sulfotransferase family